MLSFLHPFTQNGAASPSHPRIHGVAVDYEASQVYGTHQYPSVGLLLELCRPAVVHGSGHVRGAIQVLT